MNKPPTPPHEPPLDPVYLHARRESWVMLAFFTACLTWTVGYCTLYGQVKPEAPIETVMGFPAWVFWGIALPWCLASLFSIGYALWGMADDDLGQETDAGDPATHDDGDDANSGGGAVGPLKLARRDDGGAS